MPLVTKIAFDDEFATDSFGRVRVSNPATLMDTQFQYGKQPEVWGEGLTGGATSTHLPNESSIRLRCGTASGDKVIRQTHKYWRYQPGKSIHIDTTFVMGAAKEGVRKRVGYFDDNNGVFLEQNGTYGVYLVLRSNASGTVEERRYKQSEWNTREHQELDLTKSQIFTMDIQWLGVGRVRTAFTLGGASFPAHQFVNANRIDTVYMTTANLPVRYEMENLSATASNTDFIQICATVVSEGGLSIPSGLRHTASTGTTGIPVTTRRPVLSIRPKATFNSIENRGITLPININNLVSTQNVFFELVKNGTLTGDAWAGDSGSTSLVEYDTAATAITGGRIIDSGFAPAGSGVTSVVSTAQEFVDALASALSLNWDGTSQDILTLVATSTSGISATVRASINFLDIY